MLAEVMLALRHNWINESLSANEASKGQRIFVFLTVSVIIIFVFNTHSFVSLPNLLCFFPLFLYLPPRFVISTVVQKLTRVSIPTVTSFFVVLADIRLVIEPSGYSDVRRSSQWPMWASSFLAGDGLLSSKPGFVISISMDSGIELLIGSLVFIPFQSFVSSLENSLADGSCVLVEVGLGLKSRGGSTVVLNLDLLGWIVVKDDGFFGSFTRCRGRGLGRSRGEEQLVVGLSSFLEVVQYRGFAFGICVFFVCISRRSFP